MQPEFETETTWRASTHRGASAERTGAPAGVPCSNTGRKNDEGNPLSRPERFMGECEGERFEFVTTGERAELIRYPVPNESAPPRAALVDWLAFTLVPPPQIVMVSRIDGMEETGYRWMVGELARVFNVQADGIKRRKGGKDGFAHCADFEGGLIAWGGASQRGRIWVSISGEGCARIEEWPGVATWLKSHGVRLTRVDLAHDDFACETVSMEKVVRAYHEGGFNAGGRRPKHDMRGDWLDGEGATRGRTFNVGSRENGKLFRAYEKGKQLGDASSPWVRVECEWRSKSRWLPYDMVTRPGAYLAGAFPWLSFLSAEQCRVKTSIRAAKLSFDRGMTVLRQQWGKWVNLALMVFGGDYAEVVERVKREGLPARMDSYSPYVRGAPGVLAGVGA